MKKHSKTPFDPRGVIAESYLIDGLRVEDARVIFLDWVITDMANAPFEALTSLWDTYAKFDPTHHMSILIKQGLHHHGQPPKRRRSAIRSTGRTAVLSSDKN